MNNMLASLLDYVRSNAVERTQEVYYRLHDVKYNRKTCDKWYKKAILLGKVGQCDGCNVEKRGI